MIQTIAEHSVDLDLLQPRAKILDLGCRGFAFADYFREDHDVFCVDVDDLHTDRAYHRLAIASVNGRCSVRRTNDAQATHIINGSDVEKLTLPTFSERVGVDKWDLIKIDIEGAEYDILRNVAHPYAKQISVEFHEHCRGIGKPSLDELLKHMAVSYQVHNAVWESRHGAGFNYWDVLFIAR